MNGQAPQRLPVDLVVLIASHVSGDDVIRMCAVCRAWSQLQASDLYLNIQRPALLALAEFFIETRGIAQRLASYPMDAPSMSLLMRLRRVIAAQSLLCVFGGTYTSIPLNSHGRRDRASPVDDFTLTIDARSGRYTLNAIRVANVDHSTDILDNAVIAMRFGPTLDRHNRRIVDCFGIGSRIFSATSGFVEEGKQSFFEQGRCYFRYPLMRYCFSLDMIPNSTGDGSDLTDNCAISVHLSKHDSDEKGNYVLVSLDISVNVVQRVYIQSLEEIEKKIDSISESFGETVDCSCRMF